MKYNAMLTVFLTLISSHFLVGQDTNKLPVSKNDEILIQHTISNEEGWEIHKAAFKLQLEAKGYSINEIKTKMAEYEKQQKAFVEITSKLQQRFNALQIEMNGVDQQITVQKDRIASLKEIALKQEQTAEELFKEVRWLEVHASEQAHREIELLTKAKAIKEQAEAIKLLSEENWLKAENWKGNFRTLFTKKLVLNNNTNAGSGDFKHVKVLERFVFKVEKNEMIHISIQGELDEGYVLIQVWNPQRDKKGQLILGNLKQLDATKSATVTGAFNNSVLTDIVGEWQITIMATKPKGQLNMSVVQFDSDN